MRLFRVFSHEIKNNRKTSQDPNILSILSTDPTSVTPTPDYGVCCPTSQQRMEYRLLRKTMPQTRFKRLNSVHRLRWTKYCGHSTMWDAVNINAPNRWRSDSVPQVSSKEQAHWPSVRRTR